MQTMSGPSGDPPELTIEIHQNPYLAVAETEVHAIAKVRATGDASAIRGAPRPAAEVIIVDTSGSMLGARLVAAKRAARAAVDALRPGVDFAVIAGAADAAMVYPRDRLLARFTETTRRDAHLAISRLSAGGGTRIGRWLSLAAELFAEDDHPIRHAVLLTDGKNEHETPEDLDAALDRCAGRFVCDSRGVGADWEPAELRRVSARLLGRFGMVADPGDLAADFAGMIEQAMGKAVADVTLRVWTPHNATLRFFKQVYPALRDLAGGWAETGPSTPGPKTAEFPTGIWGVEDREYHLCVTVPPGEPDQTMLAARVSAVLPGEPPDRPRATGQVLATWTGDEALSSLHDPSVVHYQKLEELADASQRLLRSHEAGDARAAAAEHSRARRLAAETGSEEISIRLDRFADPESGILKPPGQVGRADIVGLDTHSSESMRPPPEAPSEREGGAEG